MRVPATHEFEDVPHQGYLFEMEPAGYNSGELNHYVEYYSRLAAQNGIDTERDEEWVEDLLMNVDWCEH